MGMMKTRAGIPDDDIIGANSHVKHPKKYPPMDTANKEGRLIFVSSFSCYKSNLRQNVVSNDGNTVSPRPKEPPRLFPILVVSKPG